MLGWCMTGHHADREVKSSKPCPGVVTDGVRTSTCKCSCHA